MTPPTDTGPGSAGEPSRLRALAAYRVLDTPPEPEFDDLAHLAAELCEAPVALVSFVAADRQWFKARVGFAPTQTDLGSSVCRFVLDEPDLLVIPDLEADWRTAANPLVSDEPGIRFYAGAPLRTLEGEVLGSLCVIDTEPRPAGLQPRQADNLRRLARQVVGHLEMRRVVDQRDRAYAQRETAVQELAESEARWRGLFERLREGFILGQALRGPDGRIEDWRYLEVNAAWGELVGVDSRAAVGRTIREVFPGIEQDWIDLAEVVDTGEAVTFTRQVGQLERWYDGRASALGPDTFSILFLEVTDRVLAARELAAGAARKSALAELGDCLRSATEERAMAHVTASIVGRTLGASRAGYGSVDSRSETVDVLPDWCAPGVASIAGRHSFRDFGSYIEDLRRGRTVVIPDVLSDPRTAASAEAWRALGIGALINAPVMEGGEIVAVCLAHWAEPHAVSSEEQGFVRSAADRAQVGVARLRAEARQAVLNGEISHRMKNTLAMVQAVAAQTLKTSAQPGALSAFSARLVALGKAQDLLLQGEWRAADLSTLATDVLDAAGAQGRYALDGPTVRLGARSALSASLLLHELTTNAVKYGALSREGGRVLLSWRWSDDDGRELVLQWSEQGGPPATTPTRRGFGSRLLRLGLVGLGGSDLVYGPEGFSASFRAPRREVEEG